MGYTRVKKSLRSKLHSTGAGEAIILFPKNPKRIDSIASNVFYEMGQSDGALTCHCNKVTLVRNGTDCPGLMLTVVTEAGEPTKDRRLVWQRWEYLRRRRIPQYSLHAKLLTLIPGKVLGVAGDQEKLIEELALLQSGGKISMLIQAEPIEVETIKDHRKVKAVLFTNGICDGEE